MESLPFEVSSCKGILFFFKDASRVHPGAGSIALSGECLPSMHRDLGFILSPHINQAWCWHILVILACER